MVGINPLNFYGTAGDMGAKMVVFETNVFGARTKFGSICKINTTAIILKDGGMSDGVLDNEFSGSSKFM